MEFIIGNYRIKAETIIPQNNNLAERYLRKFAPLENGKDFVVYNLTVNGVGRYYYSPQVNILAAYILLEFMVARESFVLLTELKKYLQETVASNGKSPHLLN